tara:strand:+ start:178 stop:426 length:249 start_codon:yes stop_codon:yes gene_type:complete
LKILYFAKLKQLIGKSEETICIEKKKKISQVINELKKRNEVYNFALKETSSLQYAVNCEYVDLDFFVTNNDELAIFPPVSGG